MAIWDSILDILFPPRCKFCGALLDKSSLDPCRKCENADFWLTPAQAVASGTEYSRCVCAVWYQDPLRTEISRFKFQNHPDHAKAYGPVLAKQIRFFLPGAYDCITWVPVSQATLKKRGYDQAQLLAEETAKALGTQAVPLLEKVKNNPAQSSLTDGRKRESNVAGVYAVPDPNLVKGQRVLVIDDIRTTGATLEEAARTLRKAGASQILAAAFCRTPRNR
ncbi:MAG: ComF family protein [Ruminiclostridium sp.]|nr:ComF family protein [Ruminiclostridium sp.]